jgi:hypothetical protein
MHVLSVGILWQSNRTNFFTIMDIFEVAEFDRRCFTHEVVVQELQLNLSYNARDLEFELHACALSGQVAALVFAHHCHLTS